MPGPYDLFRHYSVLRVMRFCLRDCATNNCRLLWYNAIPQTSKAVHPCGNPISHSTKITLNFPPAWSFKFRDRPGSAQRSACPSRKFRTCKVAHFTATSFSGLLFLSWVACDAFPDFQSRAVGVGHKEQALSDVVGTNRRSGKTVPLRIVPDLGQVSQNSAEESASTSISSGVVAAENSGYVFTHHPAGPSLANDAGELRPEVAVIFTVRPPACNAVRLTGPPAREYVNPTNSVSVQSASCKRSDIIILNYPRPVFGEYGACVSVLLTECDRTERTGPAQTQFKTTDPAEQTEYVHSSKSRAATACISAAHSSASPYAV